MSKNFIKQLIGICICVSLGIAIGITVSTNNSPKSLDIDRAKEKAIRHFNKEFHRPFDNADFLFEAVDSRTDGTVVFKGFRRSMFSDKLITHAPILIDWFWIEVSRAGHTDDCQVNIITATRDNGLNDIWQSKPHSDKIAHANP